MLFSNSVNYKSVFVILIIMRKLNQLRLHHLSYFISGSTSIPCGVDAMSILIFTKSNQWLCPHLSSSACYHGNLKASEYCGRQGEGWLPQVKGGNMALTPNKESGREIRAAHTVRRMCCHLKSVTLENRRRENPVRSVEWRMFYCTSSVAALLFYYTVFFI